MQNAQTIGPLVRQWRKSRNLSQLALAADAEIAQRHLSFVESGRSRPSKEMVLRLAEHLDVPLRERNRLLLAAGYAPVYEEMQWDDPDLAVMRKSIEEFLERQAPHPALAFNRAWEIQFANKAIHTLIEGVDPELLTPPINIIRLCLSRSGLAPRIANLADWSGHLLWRLRDQLRRTQDSQLGQLIDEAQSLGARDLQKTPAQMPLMLPLRLWIGPQLLSFLSTTTVFGGAGEISLSELTIETFVALDTETAEYMKNTNEIS